MSGEGQLFNSCISQPVFSSIVRREGYLPSALNMASVASGVLTSTTHWLPEDNEHVHDTLYLS